MAFSMNVVLLGGNLTRDIETKTVGETAIGNFGIAVSDSKKVKGEWQEVTQFFDVTVFGSLAERCAKNLKKGDSVIVDGRLDTDTWTDKDGTKKSKVKVIARDVRFGIHGKLREMIQAGKGAVGSGGQVAPF